MEWLLYAVKPEADAPPHCGQARPLVCPPVEIEIMIWSVEVGNAVGYVTAELDCADTPNDPVLMINPSGTLIDAAVPGVLWARLPAVIAFATRKLSPMPTPPVTTRAAALVEEAVVALRNVLAP